MIRNKYKNITIMLCAINDVAGNYKCEIYHNSMKFNGRWLYSKEIPNQCECNG